MVLAGKAALIWLIIAVLAVANGVFREGVLNPKLGTRVAHVVSTIILSALILGIALLTRNWVGYPSIASAWIVSGSWLLATLAFEFLAGHYLFKNPWSKILADYDVRQARVWLLIPATVVIAAPMAFYGLESRWLVPYLVSNLVAATMLVLAVTKPSFVRWLLALLFGYAGIFNSWIALSRPLEYQGFAELALIPWYRDFITGPLREYGTAIIVGIAAGQMLIAIAAALGGRWLKPAAVGCCIFLLAIVPLGVGSAAPFSFIVSLAALIVAWSE